MLWCGPSHMEGCPSSDAEWRGSARSLTPRPSSLVVNRVPSWALQLRCAHVHIHFWLCATDQSLAFPRRPLALSIISSSFRRPSPQGLPAGLLRGAPARELDSDALGSEPYSPGSSLTASWPRSGRSLAAGVQVCWGGPGPDGRSPLSPGGDEGPGLAPEDVVDALEAVG